MSRRIIFADTGWFFAAAAVALGLGVSGDYLFRRPSLGLRYQTSAERALRIPLLGSTQHSPIDLITAAELAALLAQREAVVVDVRPAVFYQLGHVPGARSLPRASFERDLPSLESEFRSPGSRLVVYCSDANCEDSAVVARLLQARGFGPLLVLAGGFDEWERFGGKVDTAP